MIITNQENSADKTLLELDKSPFNFYLTGSRELGDSRGDSDYDFYAKDNPLLRAFLISIEFEEIFTQYVGDPQIVTVYRRKYANFAGNVDVQLVRDINKKHAAQYAIEKMGGISIWGTKRMVWRTIYEAITKFEELERETSL